MSLLTANKHTSSSQEGQCLKGVGLGDSPQSHHFQLCSLGQKPSVPQSLGPLLGKCHDCLFPLGCGEE